MPKYYAIRGFPALGVYRCTREDVLAILWDPWRPGKWRAIWKLKSRVGIVTGIIRSFRNICMGLRIGKGGLLSHSQKHWSSSSMFRSQKGEMGNCTGHQNSWELWAYMSEVKCWWVLRNVWEPIFCAWDLRSWGASWWIYVSSCEYSTHIEEGWYVERNHNHERYPGLTF